MIRNGISRIEALLYVWVLVFIDYVAYSAKAEGLGCERIRPGLRTSEGDNSEDKYELRSSKMNMFCSLLIGEKDCFLEFLIFFLQVLSSSCTGDPGDPRYR